MDENTENLLPAKGQSSEKSVIVYKSDDGTIQLEVQLFEDMVWLTQAQMVVLFHTTKQNVSLHIKNIYKEQELQQDSTVKKYLTVQNEGGRDVSRLVDYYNLDVIISVGYRVKSVQGTRFRQWANNVLKEYLLRGYSINRRFERLENRVTRTEEKIEFFVKSALPPVEGIFYDGQVFDAYVCVKSQLVS